jgi:hypothetical protein
MTSFLLQVVFGAVVIGASGQDPAKSSAPPNEQTTSQAAKTQVEHGATAHTNPASSLCPPDTRLRAAAKRWVDLTGHLKIVSTPSPARKEQPRGAHVLLLSDGKELRLDFSAQPELSGKAETLDGVKVHVIGELVGAPVSGRSEVALVRVRELGTIPRGDGPEPLIARLREAREALVAYQPGRFEEAERVCKDNGLSIVRTNGTAGYFVCHWPTGIDLHRVAGALNQSPAVRYVVPNERIQVGPTGHATGGTGLQIGPRRAARPGQSGPTNQPQTNGTGSGPGAPH